MKSNRLMFSTKRCRLIVVMMLVYMFIFKQSAWGQNELKIDSLKTSLQTTKEDTSKIDILIDLALSYGNSNSKNLENLEKAKVLAVQIRDSIRLGLIDGHIASYYYYTGQYHLAIQHTTYYSDIYSQLGDTLRYIRSVNNLGILFRRIGNFHKSLECNNIQLEYYLKKQDSLNLAKTYNNLGNLYSDYGDTEKSLAFQMEGLRIRKKLEDPLGIGSAYNNIALLYENQKKSDSAIFYYKLGLTIPEIKESSTLYGAIHNNLAIVYKGKKDYDLTEYHLLKSLRFRDSVGDYHGSCQARVNLADTYRLLGKYSLAKKYALEGMELAKKYDYTDEIWRSYLNLARINKELKNFEGAYDYMVLYADLKDSIRSKDEIRKMAQVEISNKYNQKMLEDSLNLVQEKELFLKQQEIENVSIIEKQKRQEVIAWYSGGVGIVLLILVFILIKNNKEKSNTNRIISEKNTKIELQKGVLEVKNKEVLDSINYASRIQNAIHPTPQDLSEYLPEYFLLFKPKDIISGDFYWLHKFDNTLYLAVADCTGHGVPGAIVSVICANALSKSIEEGINQTGEILDRTREIVVDQLSKNNSTVQDGMDISFVRFITDENKDVQKLQWSGANNPLWILRKNSQEIEELKPNKQPIGKYANAVSFETNEVEIEKGDTIYLFTDGLADQFGGEKGKKFKRANFKSLLIKSRYKSLSHQKMDIINAFDEWKGNADQIDDICVMGIRF